MLQQSVINQSSRKKILTRKDLLTELETSLRSLRDRPQYSALRSMALDSFLATDNPFLKTLTLSELATNPIETLRDTSKIEKKEIAAIVETVYLLNLRSDYSLSLISNAFTKIEAKADSVQKVLKEILAAVPKGQKERCIGADDANAALLRLAFANLSRCPNFEKVNSKKIEEFWDPKASSCCHLVKMTWKEIMETPPSLIFSLPNFGKSRFKNLVTSIEKATALASINNSTLDPNSQSTSSNLVQEAQSSILRGIQELRFFNSEASNTLATALSKSNSNALTTLFLAQSTMQRRVGQILGITESRISQLLHEAHKSLSESLLEQDSRLVHKIEDLLTSPACSEKSLHMAFEISNPGESTAILVKMLAISLGAHSPNFKGRTIQNHWTKSKANIGGKISSALNQLPLTTQSLSEAIGSNIPNCDPHEILSVLAPNAYYLKSRDYWYPDQEQALISVLKAASKPLTAQVISKIFECGPRQMRYLLQNSKLITRIGLNNGRRYSVN